MKTLPLVRIEDKLPGHSPPRYLAEEGLYVGKRPRVSYANYNRMENRLLQQEDQVHHTPKLYYCNQEILSNFNVESKGVFTDR